MIKTAAVALLVPPAFLAFVALIGLLIEGRHRPIGRFPAWLGVLGLPALSLPAVSGLLLTSLERNPPLPPPPRTTAGHCRPRRRRPTRRRPNAARAPRPSVAGVRGCWRAAASPPRIADPGYRRAMLLGIPAAGCHDHGGQPGATAAKEGGNTVFGTGPAAGWIAGSDPRRNRPRGPPCSFPVTADICASSMPLPVTSASLGRHRMGGALADDTPGIASRSADSLAPPPLPAAARAPGADSSTMVSNQNPSCVISSVSDRCGLECSEKALLEP